VGSLWPPVPVRIRDHDHQQLRRGFQLSRSEGQETCQMAIGQIFLPQSFEFWWSRPLADMKKVTHGSFGFCNRFVVVVVFVGQVQAFPVPNSIAPRLSVESSQ